MSRANFRSLKREGRYLEVRAGVGELRAASNAGMALGTALAVAVDQVQRLRRRAAASGAEVDPEAGVGRPMEHR